jgi:hypothetical protein
MQPNKASPEDLDPGHEDRRRHAEKERAKRAPVQQFFGDRPKRQVGSRRV